MSYTELITFKNGKANGAVEYRNAWGGAARIWDSLFKAYVPPKHQYDSWMGSAGGNDNRLRDLAKRSDLPDFERAALAFTFDLFYVRNENFKRISKDFKLFVEKYPAGQNVDHLPAWSKWLNENDGVEAVALYGTSVGDNLWYRSKNCSHCGNSTDETEPVPLSEGTELYDWIDENNESSKNKVDEGKS